MPNQYAVLTESSLNADAQSNTIRIPPDRGYTVYQNVTSYTGTSFDCDVEESPDGGTTWFVAGSFTQATGTGKEALKFSPGHADLIRINYNVTTATVTVTHTIATA